MMRTCSLFHRSQPALPASGPGPPIHDHFPQPQLLPQRQLLHWQFGPHSQWVAFFDIGISFEPG